MAKGKHATQQVRFILFKVGDREIGKMRKGNSAQDSENPEIRYEDVPIPINSTCKKVDLTLKGLASVAKKRTAPDYASIESSNDSLTAGNRSCPWSDSKPTEAVKKKTARKGDE